MKNHTYWLGVNTTLAKTEISAEKAAKKKAKANFKVWGTRILVFTLAALFIISTLISVIPAFFAL